MRLLYFLLSLLSVALLSSAVPTYARLTHSSSEGVGVSDTMPNFKFYDMAGQVFTPAQLHYEQYLTFIFYDTECDHCEQQAAAIAAELSRFDKTTLLWVTIGSDEQIAAFRNRYFANAPQVLFVNDRDMNIFEAYKGSITDTPTTLIYDQSRHELVRLYKASVDSICTYYR